MSFRLCPPGTDRENWGRNSQSVRGKDASEEEGQARARAWAWAWQGDGEVRSGQCFFIKTSFAGGKDEGGRERGSGKGMKEYGVFENPPG